MNTLFKYVGALTLLILPTGCGYGPSHPADGTETESMTSPDGYARAFVWVPTPSGGLGATLSQPYQVWMKSLKIGNDQKLILEADKTAGFHLSWHHAGQLEICYADAQIARFRNRMAMVTETSLEIHEVEIVLRRVDKLDDCRVR